MGLNTGGSTSTTTTAPGNTSGQQLQQGQIGSAFNAAGGLGTFAAPSNLYNLSPGEQLFSGIGQMLSMPGAQANRALGYVMPGSPAGDMFQSYFRNFISPTVQNNAIASGYGGASGASMEALSRAGQQAAMSGLQGFGMPMAQQDMANIGTGLQLAGLQRQTQIQDLARVQNLLQSLAGMLPSTVPGGTANTTQQGPGIGASLLNLGASALLGGGGGSLLRGLGSLGSSLINGIGSLFSSPSPTYSPSGGDPIGYGTASNYFSGVAPDASLIPESDPNSLMLSQLASGGWGYD